MKMKMKTHTILIFAVGIALMVGRSAFAQTTPYPPQGGGNQSISSGKTTQSRGTSTQNPSNKSAPAKNASTQHQAGRKGNGGHSHSGAGVGVGVGATIDLGGIGQRRPEADPFAVPAERQPVTARTEEKPKTPKKTREPAKTDPFAGVQLTGPQAKGQSDPTR
jgi:hypothetical protein